MRVQDAKHAIATGCPRIRVLPPGSLQPGLALQHGGEVEQALGDRLAAGLGDEPLGVGAEYGTGSNSAPTVTEQPGRDRGRGPGPGGLPMSAMPEAALNPRR